MIGLKFFEGIANLEHKSAIGPFWIIVIVHNLDFESHSTYHAKLVMRKCHSSIKMS